jgi:hypothetical protein
VAQRKGRIERQEDTEERNTQTERGPILLFFEEAPIEGEERESEKESTRRGGIGEEGKEDWTVPSQICSVPFPPAERGGARRTTSLPSK